MDQENNEIIKKVRGRPIGSIQKVKEIKIKVCKLCNVNRSDEHKFKGKACIKCCSKKNNAMLIEKCNYYKEYYENNKKPTGNPRGRPVGSIKVKFDD